MARVTTDDLLAAINALGKESPKRPTGKGWDTVPKMAAREGVSRSSIRQRFRLAVDRGLKVERFVGSELDANGELHKCTWFRVKRQ